ncbi:bisanhydrobacterioruberin hydratase [Halobaculum sp. MBLA0147]|uniref:bisanhydrobacterioruberin hydratase n=1 Tax=Halobaculum sp. MBLA0147 TaxID=3079934 RepID=UPI0035251508
MSTSVADLREQVPESRAEFERRLDALIVDNRFTISVFFPLNGIVLLLASAEGWLPEPLAFNGLLILTGVAVMRAPLIAGVLPVADRKAALGVGLLTLYAYGIEYVGVHTGEPYGRFEYVVDLGPTLAGVPVGLPVFFLPLVVNAYLLVSLLLGERAERALVRLAAVIGLVLIMDVVLDPGAVALTFWRYFEPGAPVFGGLLSSQGGFYGVPVSNYQGWVLSATVSVVVLDRAFDREALLERVRDCQFMLDDMVSFVILWGGVNVWFGNWVPALVAGLIGVGLWRADQFDTNLVAAEFG